MMIIETCPVCGHDLTAITIATYPPIPVKQCLHCGWRWEGEMEEIVRVPFKEPGVVINDFSGCKEEDRYVVT